MEMYTLTEASAKLKKHNIIADARKLIREAIAGKLWLSIAVHGYFYSPTINAKCNNVVGKYLNNLLGIDDTENSSSDNKICEFENELIREVLDRSQYLVLSSDNKISYLINNDLINAMYERYSNPSLGGYFFVPPKQLIKSKNGVFEIEGFSDSTDTYFAHINVTIDDLLIDEYHLNNYIQSLSDKPPKPKRVNRLYAEIMDTISSWQSMSPYEILDNLKPLAGKTGSCITSVSNNRVTWLTEANIENTTNLEALQKWIARQKKT